MGHPNQHTDNRPKTTPAQRAEIYAWADRRARREEVEKAEDFAARLGITEAAFYYHAELKQRTETVHVEPVRTEAVW